MFDDRGKVITIIGYTNGSSDVNIHQFNIHHKDLLMLVSSRQILSNQHDKQGFERSTLYQKLKSRLKEMTNEYWDTHCDLVGYYKKPLPASLPLPSSGPPKMPLCSYIEIQAPVSIPSCSKPVGLTFSCNASSLAGKRRPGNPIATMQPSKRQVLTGEATTGLGPNPRSELGREVRQRPPLNTSLILEMNRKLRAECLEKEQIERRLKLKEQELRKELEEV